jgi:hypothetical protein
LASVRNIATVAGWLWLTKVVGRPVPFHWTVEVLAKSVHGQRHSHPETS